MRQGKKSHRAVTKWCTGREWPVNCMTVISARWRSHMPFQRRRKWHIPIARYRKKLWGRVHISTWEFEGNIRPTNWTEDSEKIPLFMKAGPVVAPCALSRPSSTYIEESKPHRRTILIPLLTAPTSHKCLSRKKYILLYIFRVVVCLARERNVTLLPIY